MPEAVIVSAARSPIGREPRQALRRRLSCRPSACFSDTLVTRSAARSLDQPLPLGSPALTQAASGTRPWSVGTTDGHYYNWDGHGQPLEPVQESTDRFRVSCPCCGCPAAHGPGDGSPTQARAH